MITVGEYVAIKQPEVYSELLDWEAGELFSVALTQGRVRLRFRALKRLMEERPKPGLGGLLPGEKAAHIPVGVAR
ncbi:Uncharacterized [Moorella glycerini]|uniref:Uncharacterized protein n=1 Tax=Neomoorella stamsii TaxID=1266720 RepID=A0A9X7J0I6_9FIRM|nr:MULTISPECIES: hypothetical protein [Moorella]PRR69610.1 hypothetical protein MOST_30320 [Moorella stamsii]CEP67866.1 Uncharacterized [Moorella glycerini]CEP68736.1 Uncharacterized [Moorella glycerini]